MTYDQSDVATKKSNNSRERLVDIHNKVTDNT